jgi:hypothetical protein
MLPSAFALIPSLILLQAKEPVDLDPKVFDQLQELQETVGNPIPKYLTPSAHQQAMGKYTALKARIDKISNDYPEAFRTRILHMGLRQIQTVLDLRLPPTTDSIYISSNQYISALQQVRKSLKGNVVLKNDELFDAGELQKELGVKVLNENELLSEYSKGSEPIRVLIVHPVRIKSDLLEIHVGQPVFEVRDAKPIFAISDWAVVYMRFDCQTNR